MASRHGLAKLLNTLRLLCKVIGVFGVPLREVVPLDKREAYDAALAALLAACEVVLAIDFVG